MGLHANIDECQTKAVSVLYLKLKSHEFSSKKGISVLHTQQSTFFGHENLFKVPTVNKPVPNKYMHLYASNTLSQKSLLFYKKNDKREFQKEE